MYGFLEDVMSLMFAVVNCIYLQYMYIMIVRIRKYSFMVDGNLQVINNINT